MTGPLLKSGSLSAYHPVGAVGNPVYLAASQLRAAIARRLGAEVANTFAIPQRNEDGDAVDWYAPLPGPVVPWSAASDTERADAQQQLLSVRSQVEDLGHQMEAEASPERQVFGRLLAQVMSFPDENDVHLVNGQPVLTFWGFVRDRAAVGSDPLRSLDTHRAEINAPSRRRPLAWLPWTLLGLLLLLLLLLALLGLRGCEGLPWAADEPAPAPSAEARKLRGGEPAPGDVVAPPVEPPAEPMVEPPAEPAPPVPASAPGLSRTSIERDRLIRDHEQRRLDLHRVEGGGLDAIGRDSSTTGTAVDTLVDEASRPVDAMSTDLDGGTAPADETSATEVTLTGDGTDADLVSDQGVDTDTIVDAAADTADTATPDDQAQDQAAEADATPPATDAAPVATDDALDAGSAEPATDTAAALDDSEAAPATGDAAIGAETDAGEASSDTTESASPAEAPGPAETAESRSGVDATATTAAAGERAGTGASTGTETATQAGAATGTGPGAAAAAGIAPKRLLNSSWRTATTLLDPKDGSPIHLDYRLKDGAGRLRLTRQDGSVCESGAAAKVQDGRLVVDSAAEIVCADGTSFGRPQIDCTPRAGGKARCVGRYADGSTFPIDMQQQPD